MTKRLVLMLAPLALVPLAACGGGNDTDHATPSGASPTLTATPTLVAPSLPSPSPVADDALALQVVRTDGKGGGKTAAELRALPQTDMNLDGGKQTGITLAELGKEVEAPATAIATVTGRSLNGTRVGIWRGTIADNGTTAMVVIDSQGLVSLVGSSIPKEQWLTVVESVSFSST
jgi:hypothetical protein